MFKCEECKGVQSAGSQPIKKVVSTRVKIYPKRYNQSNQCIDNGGTGKEIVKELSLCKKCASKY